MKRPTKTSEQENTGTCKETSEPGNGHSKTPNTFEIIPVLTARRMKQVFERETRLILNRHIR